MVSAVILYRYNTCSVKQKLDAGYDEEKAQQRK